MRDLSSAGRRSVQCDEFYRGRKCKYYGIESIFFGFQSVSEIANVGTRHNGGCVGLGKNQRIILNLVKDMGSEMLTGENSSHYLVFHAVH